MSYPPGGYPPPSPYPPPPERSPWSSPPVLVAIVAGVLILVAGVAAALLFIPGDDDSDSATTTSSQSTITSTVTGRSDDGTSTVTVPTTTQTTTTSTPDRQAPTIPGTDASGFVAGPRCNAPEDPVVMAGQTDRSRMVICQVGTQTGRWYYKGLAPEGGIEIGYPTRSGDTFVARNGSIVYTISPSRLVITDGGSVIADEAMIAYWSAS